MSENDDEQVEECYESGPFCRHWSELGFCDSPCACGHECGQHGSYDDGPCLVDGCVCKAFKDVVEVVK